MQDDSVIISLRVPKGMNRDMDKRVAEGRYASRTELLREAIREKLYESIGEMRGALKGKVKVRSNMRAWRLKQGKNALKRANGNPYKASELMDKDEKEALRGLRL